MFLFFLGFALHSAASFPLFYSKVCLSKYDKSICDNLSSRPEIENDVQLVSSEWMAYIELARFIPTLLGTMFLGSFADHYSTKSPVLISLAFMVVYMSTYTALVSFEKCPLYLIIIASTVLAIAGQIASFVTCLYTFLAKVVSDENALTFRYAVLTAFWSASYVVAGNVAPFLYVVLSYQYVMVIGQGVVIATFLLALVFYPKESDSISISDTEKLSHQNPRIQADGENGDAIGENCITPPLTSVRSVDSGYASTNPKKKQFMHRLMGRKRSFIPFRLENHFETERTLRTDLSDPILPNWHYLRESRHRSRYRDEPIRVQSAAVLDSILGSGLVRSNEPGPNDW